MTLIIVRIVICGWIKDALMLNVFIVEIGQIDLIKVRPLRLTKWVTVYFVSINVP